MRCKPLRLGHPKERRRRLIAICPMRFVLPTDCWVNHAETPRSPNSRSGLHWILLAHDWTVCLDHTSGTVRQGHEIAPDAVHLARVREPFASRYGGLASLQEWFHRFTICYARLTRRFLIDGCRLIDSLIQC